MYLLPNHGCRLSLMSSIFAVFDTVFRCLHLETMFVGLWRTESLKGYTKKIEYINCGTVIYL